MMKLRRLTKMIKRYIHFFQYEQEEFRDNIDFHLDNLEQLIINTNLYISSTQKELADLYKANNNLYTLTPMFVFKPFIFIVKTIFKKRIEVKNKHILVSKRYKKYFENLLEYLKRMKYQCDL